MVYSVICTVSRRRYFGKWPRLCTERQANKSCFQHANSKASVAHAHSVCISMASQTLVFNPIAAAAAARTTARRTQPSGRAAAAVVVAPQGYSARASLAGAVQVRRVVAVRGRRAVAPSAARRTQQIVAAASEDENVSTPLPPFSCVHAPCAGGTLMIARVPDSFRHLSEVIEGAPRSCDGSAKVK